MPLLKEWKKQLAKKYVASVESAKNVVVLKQFGIPVNEMNAVRMDISEAQGRLEIVKKRVFLKGVETSYDGLTLDQMDGQIAILYSDNEEDEYAPLKVIAKHAKVWKKAKAEFTFDYVGGWYDKIWKDASHVSELANLPTKEELVGKFLFLLNYPITSFARGLQAIADKDGEAVDEAPKEEVASEAPVVEETQQEEAQEQQAEETQQEQAE